MWITRDTPSPLQAYPEDSDIWEKVLSESPRWVKSSGMLRYTIFQYYIKTNVSKFFYSCDFRTPLVSAAIWCKNCLQYNLENGFFDLEITWKFLPKKLGTLYLVNVGFSYLHL